MRLVFAALAATLTLFSAVVLPSRSASALDYPNRPVRVLIPFTAGGAPDVLMRLVGQALSEKWGQGVVIENRAGGNTMVGTVAQDGEKFSGAVDLYTSVSGFLIENGKFFAYFWHDHHGDGETAVLVKTSGLEEQAMLIEADPNCYFKPAYLGPSGWVAMRLDRPDTDWDRVSDRIATSWELVAPRRLLEMGGR